ncbi:MAG: PD40 domain-containing protein [Chloroflexi bacterium]|uniref:PD40 domain-containing protein n=1 Tax=Candidatus Chlorohelix allophototropha TaxID=3003348 RepID=A0A8T7MAN6_9CHLR|nr:PD40 domain-containing protein [Chloroflexota bacterium]WJW69029.1 hypothetical protein OZ401_002621 [Chloroflexota bacterium L227-S17]
MQRYLLAALVVILTGLLIAACGDTTSPVNPTPTITPVPATTKAVQVSPTAPPLVIAPVTTPTGSQQPAKTTVQPVATTINTSSPRTIFYYKDEALWYSGATPKKLTDNVFSYVLTSDGKAVFLQKVNKTLQLKMAQIKDNHPLITTLDDRAFAERAMPNTGSNPDNNYGVESRAISGLGISPDQTQVAYARANQSGVTFEGLLGKVYPTEIWVANLDPANPAPRKLVANDKDYAARPVWSSDGNRIAFIRTTFFGTGAGYETAFWSVYKDGTRLSFLTGPELGTVNGTKYTALPAYNIRWISPLELSFQAANQTAKTSLWVHDITSNSDFPRSVALDLSWERAYYCEQVRRFVYINDINFKPLGIFTANADKTETPVALDPTATALLGCYGDNVLYKDANNQLYLQSIKANGSSTTPKRRIGNPVSDNAVAVFSPDGNYIAIFSNTSTPAMTIFRANGSQVNIKGTAPRFKSFSSIGWSDNQMAVLIGGSDSAQGIGVDLASNEPEFRIIDDNIQEALLLVSEPNTR